MMDKNPELPTSDVDQEKEMTDISNLIDEIEGTQFILNSSNESVAPDDTEENLLMIEQFNTESQRKLSVIEEEHSSHLVSPSSTIEEENVTSHSGTYRTEKLECLELASPTLEMLDKALKDLINLKGQNPLLEDNECGKRLTPRVRRRPESSHPVLEKFRGEGPVHAVSNTNNVVKQQRPTGDLNSLNEELAKLLSISESLTYSPVSSTRVSPSPNTAPATPPSAPPILWNNTPIKPTEIYKRSRSLNNQTRNNVPPPKPPRSYKTFQGGGGEGAPPKPPRLKVIFPERPSEMKSALSKSTGNLSNQGDSSKTDNPLRASFSSDGCDGNKNATSKVENFFLKFTNKRKSKRRGSHNIGNPTQFQHLSGSTILQQTMIKKATSESIAGQDGDAETRKNLMEVSSGVPKGDQSDTIKPSEDDGS